MKLIFRIAVVYLVALFFFAWGVAAVAFQIFPYSLIKSVQAFVEGDQDETLSVLEKLENDLGGTPTRMMREYKPLDAEKFETFPLERIQDRRGTPRIWIAPGAPEAYRLLIAAFDFEQSFWGAILLDPQGREVHRWYLNAELPELMALPDTETDTLKNLYGIALFPDGSMAVNLQESASGLIKFGYCSEIDWVKKGIFHHVATPTEDNAAFWTYGGYQGDLHPILILVDAETGETLREIDMAEVEKANVRLPIFDMRRGSRGDQATHPNHIEALPSTLAQAFPQFEAGDLVQSYHTTNLIFVMDPDTLQIKWWYTGAGDGQHDPDWHADGTISIFNNRYRSDRRGLPEFSTIEKIDLTADTHRTVIDGAEYNFYSKINGQHQFTDYGTVIIASATQGRIFEVDLDSGEIVFDFVNVYDWEDGRALHVSEAFVIDQAMAERWLQTDCSDIKQAEGG